MNKVILLLLFPTFVLAVPKNFSPAVNSLWHNAKNYYQHQQFEQAANSLERALRIEQNNPYLWHGLAGVRLAQKEWKRATNLATKSLTLTGSDEELREKNKRLITQACQNIENCIPPEIIPKNKFRDPYYLHQLAASLLKEEKWARAISLSRQSIKLAGGQNKTADNLRIKNWVLITQACEEIENWECTRQARTRAQTLLQK